MKSPDVILYAVENWLERRGIIVTLLICIILAWILWVLIPTPKLVGV